MFDCVEHFIVGKTYAVSLGVVSSDNFDMFFESAEGRRIPINEMSFIANNGLRIEWRNKWGIDALDNHHTFRMMPVDSVPSDLLSARLAAFQVRLACWKSDMDSGKFRIVEKQKTRLLDRYTKTDTVTDSEYEFSVIYFCRESIAAIKRHTTNP